MNASPQPEQAAPQPSTVTAAPRGAQGTVRRIVVYTILFVLVSLTAWGVAGLLGRLFETRPEFGSGAGGLALALAFTLIGGPLAVLLWWFAWRRLDGPERASVAWGLYIAVVSVVALITFTTSLLGMFADLVGGRWTPDGLATGIAWLAVWIAHRIMWAHPRKGPLRLATVPVVVGAAFGLVVAASGAITALSALFDAALQPGEGQLGAPWWRAVLQALVWAVGGALVWWWQWRRDGAGRRTGGFADVVLVLVGVLAAAAATLAGVGTALFVGLRAAFDRSDPWATLLDPLGLALAAAGVGAIVWISHRGVVARRAPATREAARLVEAGVGLVGAASGVGVIVNALLASFSSPLAGDDARSLLLGAVAALAVGAPVWWWAWRPRNIAAEAGPTARRVYLIAVFGVSAVVAIVALLVVGYRVFELVLGADGGNLIERVRAPFGLLVATAVVAAYHFAVWRRDRASAPASRTRTFERVILVAGGDTTAAAQAVRAATGASVTTWTRDDSERAPDAEAVIAALDSFGGGAAPRVLVLASDDGRLEVVPLRT